MKPAFTVVKPGGRTSYRSLARAILDARGGPILCGGKPVTWRAVRIPDGAMLYARWAA